MLISALTGSKLGLTNLLWCEIWSKVFEVFEDEVAVSVSGGRYYALSHGLGDLSRDPCEGSCPIRRISLEFFPS